MSSLHRHGICHGGLCLFSLLINLQADISNSLPDFTPRNVLLRISSLDGLTENQVLKAFGQPIQVKVVTMTGEIPCDSTAPKYLVKPIDFYSVDSQFMTNEACVIDFGESFEVSSPPEDLGIPQSYCSPELVLDKIAGVGSDSGRSDVRLRNPNGQEIVRYI